MDVTPYLVNLRPLRSVRSGLVLGIWLGCTVATADPLPELRKVHALLVVDTRSGLGESVKVDGQRMFRLLSNNLPRDRVEIHILTGKDVNRENILGFFRSIHAGRNDCLFFYYAGHGAVDPTEGAFLALQELDVKPLPRSELRKVMQEQHAGLVVLMTDCCSNRFKLKGKPRRVIVEEGTARTIQPVLRCLLFQSRGLVDITAASGNAAFGDDHEGGIFTRSFDQLVRGGIEPLDADGDGFVSWPEFFARLQAGTEGAFVTWAQHQRALGEKVDQSTQKPHAYELAGRPDAVSLRNEAGIALDYEYRWAGSTSWEQARIPPHGIRQHMAPAGRDGAAPALEVRFEGGKTARLHLGKTYRFHDTR